MMDPIINDIKNQIRSHFTKAIEKFNSLQDFDIIKGQFILNSMGAPEELKDSMVRPDSYYVIMKFSGQGTRETAEKCFKFMMEDCLNLPRSTESILDEVFPKKEYAPEPNLNLKQLNQPSKEDLDYIDIDDDGNVIQNQINKKSNNQVSIDVKPRFYAVELRIEGRAPTMIGNDNRGSAFFPHRRNQRYLQQSFEDDLNENELSFFNKINNKIRLEDLGK